MKESGPCIICVWVFDGICAKDGRIILGYENESCPHFASYIGSDTLNIETMIAVPFYNYSAPGKIFSKG